MFDCFQARWSEKTPLKLKSLSSGIVEKLGTLKTPVKGNNWETPKAKTTVVADGCQPIVEQDLFDQLGITISQNKLYKI